MRKENVEVTSKVDKQFFIPLAVFDELDAKGLDLKNGLMTESN